MSKMKTFNEISTPNMLAMILRQTNRGDEALSYLLTAHQLFQVSAKIARAMGITCLSYRVRQHHAWVNLRKFRKRERHSPINEL